MLKRTSVRLPLASSPSASSARKARRALVVPRAADVDASPLRLGSVELPTPLGIGCWSWGNTAFWNDSWGPADEAAARAAFRAAMQNDIVFFDTAEAYNGPENTGSFAGFAQGSASSEVRRYPYNEGHVEGIGTPLVMERCIYCTDVVLRRFWNSPTSLCGVRHAIRFSSAT